MVVKMTEIPSNPRRAAGNEPRKPANTDKSPEQVINEAPLQTIPTQQVIQHEPTKPWLEGYNMTEDELMDLTVKKSFNLPLLLQAQMDYYLDEQKKGKRGTARNKLTETEVLKMALTMFFKSEFKKKG